MRTVTIQSITDVGLAFEMSWWMKDYRNLPRETPDLVEPETISDELLELVASCIGWMNAEVWSEDRYDECYQDMLFETTQQWIVENMAQ